ncbi:MAG TPA: hypothetical protein VFU98_04535, partial [Microlunatus sp.]|nr:hypothetical protein [Microlunatus sp.]
MTDDGTYETGSGESTSTTAALSRRLILGGGAALGVGIALNAAPAQAAPGRLGATWNGPAARRAVRFLKGVVNAYRTSGPRLAQSYQDASGLTDTAFVYDNALAVIALLSAGEGSAARALGDGLLYAQAHDEKFTDGRLRQAYHADTFINDNGTAHVGREYGLTGTAVGDMSWAGIALAQLARATGVGRYRDGAVKIATWIQRNTHSTSGLGGYTFGETANLENHKSTEHNIDVAAFFRLVQTLTSQKVWRDRADHAWAFVEQVWNAEDGFFWTGSDDGAAINKLGTQLPLDAQTWSWLARRQGAYARALDWGAANLATTDTPLRLNSALRGRQSVTGVAFGSGSLQADPTVPIDQWNPKPDSGAVWFEGTSQLALALADRNRRGDRAAAQALLDAAIWAQAELGAGQQFGGKRIDGGVVAASS